MLFRIMCIAILACLSLAAFADSPNDTVTIPLKDIWAKDMPGTKDVRELEPEIYGDGMRNISDSERERRLNKSLVAHVGRGSPNREKGPDSGFAVAGIGHNALENAYAVLHDKKSPQSVFALNDDISVIFFSYVFGDYVYLDHVERRGNSIEIYYRFEPHQTMEVTSHYALIPLGNIPAGKYDVTLVQLPINSTLFPKANNTTDKKSEEKYICKPFSFLIQ